MIRDVLEMTYRENGVYAVERTEVPEEHREAAERFVAEIKCREISFWARMIPQSHTVDEFDPEAFIELDYDEARRIAENRVPHLVLPQTVDDAGRFPHVADYVLAQ